ncbi:MAG: hypothetical protein AB1742_00740 [bacterium]
MADKKKRLPEMKKEIMSFLTNEDGKIAKRAIVTGAMALLALGITAEVAYGHNSHSSHGQWLNNYLHNSGTTGGHYSHYSHASHASHASHSSHGSW